MDYLYYLMMVEHILQAPFEDITEEKYHELMKSLIDINLDNVVEIEDNTNLKGELACAGGACEIV